MNKIGLGIQNDDEYTKINMESVADGHNVELINDDVVDFFQKKRRC